jgi:hypothetical protein
LDNYAKATTVLLQDINTMFSEIGIFNLRTLDDWKMELGLEGLIACNENNFRL